MQKLLVFQSLWAMERHQPDGIEFTIEESVEKIIAAGYDGISVPFIDRSAAKRVSDLLAGTGLGIEGMCFPASVEGLKIELELAAELGVHHLDIQPDIRPRRVSEAVAILEGWDQLASQVDFPVVIETHRNRMTNDLFFTLDLIESFPRIKLLADLSHYVVSREWWPPVAEENHRHVHRILDHAWAFHGRVASQEQIQVEVSFPQHKAWFDLFLEWWGYGFASWRRRAGPEETLSFVCELGPQPYAISGANGYDLSDRWNDALILRDRVKALWKQGQEGMASCQSRQEAVGES